MTQFQPSLAVGLSPFRPRFPWLTGDLQTLRNNFTAARVSLDAWPAQPWSLDLADGDRLLGSLRGPVDAAPLALLIHGLGGCEDSIYLRETARCCLAAGYAVLALNLRGAGPSRPHCRSEYHAGRSADLHAVFTALQSHQQGILPIGYSLGANMLLKALGELGDEAPALGIVAAAAVAAPIDLAQTAEAIARPRNRVYQHYILRFLKQLALTTPGLPAETARMVKALRRVRDFDDRFIAPRNGFDGVEDYYARSSSLAFLPRITVPSLLIHAWDDPWIPPAAYRDFNWGTATAITPLLSAAGGHVGFHDAAGDTWHNRAILTFLAHHAPSNRAASQAP